jgi:1-acyl-sn-glycerol-3-phosphate acyltransferase
MHHTHQYTTHRFGTCMWLNNWPFVSRDWKQDSVYLKKLYNMYKEDDMPLVLWIFPEGMCVCVCV